MKLVKPVDAATGTWFTVHEHCTVTYQKYSSSRYSETWTSHSLRIPSTQVCGDINIASGIDDIAEPVETTFSTQLQSPFQQYIFASPPPHWHQ